MIAQAHPELLAFAASPFGGFGAGRVIDCIVNRVPAGAASDGGPLDKPGIRVIGAVPENADVAAARSSCGRARG